MLPWLSSPGGSRWGLSALRMWLAACFVRTRKPSGKVFCLLCSGTVLECRHRQSQARLITFFVLSRAFFFLTVAKFVLC